MDARNKLGHDEELARMETRVLIAAVVAASGVKGAVKLRAFTADPRDVVSYGPLESEDGRRHFKVEIIQEPRRETIVARLSGINDRDAAEALKGSRLFVPRAVLPETEDDEFFLADLIGLDAIDSAGNPIGKVTAVQNFGAGDLIEVAGRFFTFTRDVVPLVDLANKRLVIEPPAEIEP